MSVPTAVSLLAALLGAGTMRALTDLPPVAAMVIGALAGWLIGTIVLGSAAERADRQLHRMGGTRRLRRRGRRG